MDPLEGISSWRQLLADARLVVEPFAGAAAFGIAVFFANRLLSKTKMLLSGSGKARGGKNPAQETGYHDQYGG